VPAGSLAAECLALETIRSARELHAKALRTEKSRPWHALRIGLKRFRYTVEGLLPEQYAAWSDNLKRVQDLLGDVHDLDVLARPIRKSDSVETGIPKNLGRNHRSQHHERIETYRQSLWAKPVCGMNGAPASPPMAASKRLPWRGCARRPGPRSAFPAHLVDFPHRRNPFDALRRADCAPAFRGCRFSAEFAAAARLQGVGGASLKSLRRKALASSS